MVQATSVPTRGAGDVARIAADIAVKENRSFSGQISRWARIGMYLERSDLARQRRLLDGGPGLAPFSKLSGDVGVAANAHIDARIAELATGQSFGARARAMGHRTVSIDDDGNLIQIQSDGSRTPM